MNSAPLAVVTGAAGFVGRAVVVRLLADGWRVRRLLRRPSDVPFRGGETVVGDLSDEGALRRLVEGADAVVHAAGVNRSWRTADYYEVNVEGAHRLGRAVRAAAPGTRLVVVSSLAARFPWLSAYAASKADGEDAVVEAAGSRAWVVLRLAPVYGPADRKTLAVMEAATWKLMPVPDRPRARVSLLNITDAAAAVAAACGPGAPRGAVWEVGEGERSWPDIARTVVRSVVGMARVMPVAPQLLALGGVLTHPLGSGVVPLLAPGRVAELSHEDWVARPQRRPPEALWRARIGLDAGLHDAAEWFRANGWLPQPVVLAATRQRDRASPQLPG